MASSPVPGLAGIEHVGLTVPDIDAATSFLASVLDAETLYDIGPFARSDEWMATNLARGGQAGIRRLRVLRVANGPVLELIELAAQRPSMAGGPSRTPAAETGFHIAFYVDDMDRALAALKENGAPILSGPVVMTEGPSAGLTWLYFAAPWGLQFELVSYPDGIAAYRGLTRPVWRPIGD